VRPYATFDDQFNPVTMDKLLQALGAEVVRYPLKTKCCGGSLTGTLPEAGIRMVYILLNEARKRGADCLATVCPLCQFNLDGYHAQLRSQYGDAVVIPTVYFSQLMVRIGFYVCHCGTTSRSMVDCPEVAKYVGDAAERRALARLQVHVLRPGPGADPEGHPEHKLNRVVVASCSPLLHEHTFRRPPRRRPQPVLLPHGQHPRAQLLGAHRPQGGHAKAKALARAAVDARGAPQALDVKARADEPDVLVVGGGIAGITPPHAGQRGQEGLPGRARALHRRAHGEVRQDLPDARLRGLHPHAEDVRGGIPPEHHALDLLRGDEGGRLRGQLHRHR
jgi:hypothetical protein